jgi:3-oxoacyl-[acyl-carrier-protein] synthase III
MGACIHAIEYYLPEKILSNIQLADEFSEWEADKIEEKIGVRNRHIVTDDETALDLAYNASEKLFTNYDRQEIDFILLCTQSPDYFLPTGACILQDKLELRKNIGALDYNLGCSGFIYGLAMSKSLINSRFANNILLITAETYSKHIYRKDKANRSIFGDGAAAIIVSSASTESIHEFELGTDGSGRDNLIVRGGALKLRSPGVTSETGLFMDGPEIFNFTLDIIPALVINTLKKNNLTIGEIDYFIFHQANKFMLEYLRKKLQIDPGKFYINILEIGNTVSATIPIALKDCLEKQIVKPNDKVLIVGFGVGYSWGATILTI